MLLVSGFIKCYQQD